jgi:hypothetical protein
MPDALAYLAVLALVALTVSQRRRVGRAALRWLSGAGRDASLRGRAVRASRRTGGTVAGAAALYGTAVAPEVTLPVLAVLASGGAGYGAYRAREWQRRRSHHRRWVRPAYMAAQDIARWPEDEHPGKWLTVAPDRSIVTARLPLGWKGEASEQARLSQVLAARIGIDSPVIRWQLAGPKPRLELTQQSAPPPSLVTLADAMAAILAAKEDEVVWGLGRKRKPVKKSLSGDSPHVGISAGSGGGKSVTVRSLLAQMLHKGAIAIILDIKMISHQWAANLPNVVIYRRPAEIHAAMVWLGGELDRRNEVALAGADEDGNVNADVGPRIIVVGEELNATMDALRGYWRDIRAPDDPVRSPALTAFDAVSFMGRQVLTNIIYVGQALSARAMGGGRDSTENVGVIAFARTTQRTWKMLAPDFAMPPKDNHIGRLHVVSDQVETAQGIFMSPHEAKEFAVSGVVSPLPAGMPGAPVQAGGRPVQAGTLALRSGEDQRFVPADQGFSVSVVSPGTPAVTLREAVEAGVLRMSLAAARKRRTRDHSFPEPVDREGTAELYDLTALADWAGARNG